jgi:hypothetical protein
VEIEITEAEVTEDASLIVSQEVVSELGEGTLGWEAFGVDLLETFITCGSLKTPKAFFLVSSGTWVMSMRPMPKHFEFPTILALRIVIEPNTLLSMSTAPHMEPPCSDRSGVIVIWHESGRLS